MGDFETRFEPWLHGRKRRLVLVTKKTTVLHKLDDRSVTQEMAPKRYPLYSHYGLGFREQNEQLLRIRYVLSSTSTVGVASWTDEPRYHFIALGMAVMLCA